MGKYPSPAYHFLVQWGGTRQGFSEVSGLNIMADVKEYAEGSNPAQSTVKMPGRIHYSNIVLKRGIVKGDNDFYLWMNTIKLNTAVRRDIIISLLNENHEPVVSWKVKNSFPVKLTGPVLSSDAGSIAIEELELAHEGISVEMPS